MAILTSSLTAGTTLIFKVGPNTQFTDRFPGASYAVTSMFFCNLSQNPTNLTVFLVPQGGFPTGSNTVIKSLPIAGLDTFTFDTEKIILDLGDSIHASATNTDMSIVLSLVRVA